MSPPPPTSSSSHHHHHTKKRGGTSHTSSPSASNVGGIGSQSAPASQPTVTGGGTTAPPPVDYEQPIPIIQSLDDFEKFLRTHAPGPQKHDAIQWFKARQEADRNALRTRTATLTAAKRHRHIVTPGFTSCPNAPTRSKFNYPTHYIRSCVYRGYVQPLRLSRDTVRYDIMREDLLFLQQLNRVLQARGSSSSNSNYTVVVGMAGGTNHGEVAPIDLHFSGGTTSRPRKQMPPFSSVSQPESRAPLASSGAGTDGNIIGLVPLQLEENFLRLIDQWETNTGFGQPIAIDVALGIGKSILTDNSLPIWAMKQIYQTWIDRRNQLQKPLLREYWGPPGPHIPPNFAVFHMRLPGNEHRVSLRRPRRSLQDAANRFDIVLANLRRVERILRQVVKRDRQKLLITELNTCIFEQMRQEVIDPTYASPYWNHLKRTRFSQLGEPIWGEPHKTIASINRWLDSLTTQALPSAADLSIPPAISVARPINTQPSAEVCFQPCGPWWKAAEAAAAAAVTTAPVAAAQAPSINGANGDLQPGAVAPSLGTEGVAPRSAGAPVVSRGGGKSFPRFALALPPISMKRVAPRKYFDADGSGWIDWVVPDSYCEVAKVITRSVNYASQIDDEIPTGGSGYRLLPPYHNTGMVRSSPGGGSRLPEGLPSTGSVRQAVPGATASYYKQLGNNPSYPSVEGRSRITTPSAAAGASPAAAIGAGGSLPPSSTATGGGGVGGKFVPGEGRMLVPQDYAVIYSPPEGVSMAPYGAGVADMLNAPTLAPAMTQLVHFAEQRRLLQMLAMFNSVPIAQGVSMTRRNAGSSSHVGTAVGSTTRGHHKTGETTRRLISNKSS